jgi:hypothetical protein
VEEFTENKELIVAIATIKTFIHNRLFDTSKRNQNLLAHWSFADRQRIALELKE